MHNFSSLLNITLHVSDGLSAHHQDCTYSIRCMSYRFVDCMLACSNSISYCVLTGFVLHLCLCRNTTGIKWLKALEVVDTLQWWYVVSLGRGKGRTGEWVDYAEYWYC